MYHLPIWLYIILYTLNIQGAAFQKNDDQTLKIMFQNGKKHIQHILFGFLTRRNFYLTNNTYIESNFKKKK